MRPLTLFLLAAALGPSVALAQERVRATPLFAEYERFRAEVDAGYRGPNAQAEWLDANRLVYRDGEEWVTFEPRSGRETRSKERPRRIVPTGPTDPNARRRNPGRAAQFTESFSADGKVRAFTRGGNVWVEREGSEAKAITDEATTDGKVRYGTATWVYGEELYQREGLGVSPDGTRVWFYRFDERAVPFNMIVGGQRTYRATFEPQAYPKPGDPNPVVDLFVSDLATGARRPVQVRPGQFDDGVGHYVYDIQWAADGSELLFRRTDRRQRTMQLCAANPATGAVRVVVEETAPTYTENRLGLQLLDRHEQIGQAPRFRGKALYETERNGFVNLSLLDLRTGQLTPLTQNRFDLNAVERVDLADGRVWYLAGSERNPALRQLWVVGLDGRGNRRVTDPAWHHSVELSRDGAFFVDTVQRLDEPPVVRLVRADGTLVKTLAKGSDEGWQKAGIQRVERFEYLAADGVTTLFGRLNRPAGFDPSRRYPVLVSIYGGPLDPRSGDHSETFQRPESLCGFGFIVVELTNRGTGGRGKAHRDALYGKMGVTEIDDIAAGVRELVKRPYIDASRLGIFGTSYGGYASLLSILRYPDLYRAASVSSCVSDWRHYDSIYTERYMGLLGENEEAYKAGSAMTYLDALKGWVLFYFGTSDENTLPANALQVMSGLNRRGKAYDLVVGVDEGHSGVNTLRMVEFFLDRMAILRLDP